MPWTCRLLATALISLSMFAGIAATGQDLTPAQLWDDFNHYVLIARPELAADSASALLSRVDAQQLLDIVEASRFEDYQQTLVRASKLPAVEAVAAKLDEKIQQAMIARIRDPRWIRSAIERLAAGRRAQMRATVLLSEAGQYAAPPLLEYLLDPKHEALRPYVLTAMVQVGQPLIYPLSEALPQLESVAQGQVAQVLAEIGYPRAIASLKQVAEDPNTDASAMRYVQVAFARLAEAASVPATTTAAQLYLDEAQALYYGGSVGKTIPGYDGKIERGIVWDYTPKTGLVKTEVPGEIFADVLAMRAARRALALDSGLDAALSVWLAANLRRENRLAGVGYDPTYRQAQEPAYYLKMAGPYRQRDVLARALDDGDAALARDAIAALAQTAGTDVLLGEQTVAGPLVAAMDYPDRRVRFEAAFALTNARPTTAFPGSFRVAPVLAEAVRQTHQQYALVIAPVDQQNHLLLAARHLGYVAIGAPSLEQAMQQVRSVPGIDLVITAVGPDDFAALHGEARQINELRTAPQVAVAAQADLADTNALTAQMSGVFVVAASADAGELAAAIAPAIDAYAGAVMNEDEALGYALHALALLRDVALVGDDIYKIADVQPALIQALGDPRSDVVVAAANVLSLIDSQDAQRAVADVGLDANVAEDVRIAVLGSLADSATHYGKMLRRMQEDRVLELVESSTGDLAITAARAHGALALPTANAVRLLGQ